MDANQDTDGGFTPLYTAAQNGRADLAKLLLANQGVDADRATDGGFTPLCIAAYKGHTAHRGGCAAPCQPQRRPHPGQEQRGHASLRGSP